MPIQNANTKHLAFMKKPKKSKRGGRRPGAGRKPTVAGDYVSVMLEPEQVEWLKGQPGGVSAAIRAAVTVAMDAAASAPFIRHLEKN
jgi:hypothetical protein